MLGRGGAKMLNAFKALKGASRRFEEGERSGTPLSSEDDAFFRVLRDRLKVEGYTPAELRKTLLS